MTRIVVALTAACAAGVIAVGAGGASSNDGRDLAGAFCGSRCISLTFNTDAVTDLRPGVYWVTVNDTSTFHDFALRGPDGEVQSLSTIPGTGSETVKINLAHGPYRIFCQADSHEAQGMFVDFEVGGVGQVE
jgi:hypothetical protein